jgi:hypothetical protein
MLHQCAVLCNNLLQTILNCTKLHSTNQHVLVGLTGEHMSKKAMKLALEALENSIDLVSQEARNAEELYGKYPTRLARIQGLVAFEVAHEKAITALREALAEQPAQQEPVAWIVEGMEIYWHTAPDLNDWIRQNGQPLYTSPPAQRTWVGLTDIEIQEIWFTHLNRNSQARAIEAKLKEKNT